MTGTYDPFGKTIQHLSKPEYLEDPFWERYVEEAKEAGEKYESNQGPGISIPLYPPYKEENFEDFGSIDGVGAAGEKLPLKMGLMTME